MQELRALDVRRHLAHLKIEGNELPRVLDDLTARHNETRQVIERYARNLEELERQPLDRTAAAMSAAIATPRAGNLAGLDRLRALVHRPQNLALLREKHGLEGRRTDVYAQISFFCHNTLHEGEIIAYCRLSGNCGQGARQRRMQSHDCNWHAGCRSPKGCRSARPS